MGIADTEQKILEELQQLSDEPEQDNKDSEELLQEVTGETKEEEEPEDENSEEETENSETGEDAGEEEGEEVEEEEDVEEEKGAKLRHKRKAEKEALQNSQRETFELRERLARLEGMAEAKPPPEAAKVEEIPDPDYEPEKYAIYEAKQARNEVAKAREEIKELKAEQSRIGAERSWETMQTEHAKTNPDYNNAKEFLLKHETDKIKAQYPYATDAQIAQTLKQGEYGEVAIASKAGVLPTKHIEFLAYQAGYRAESTQKEAPKQKPNIKQIKKNAKKNASLIGGSSAGETGDHRSAQQLLDMSIEDINKFGRDKFKKAIQKIEARTA